MQRRFICLLGVIMHTQYSAVVFASVIVKSDKETFGQCVQKRSRLKQRTLWVWIQSSGVVPRAYAPNEWLQKLPIVCIAASWYPSVLWISWMRFSLTLRAGLAHFAILVIGTKRSCRCLSNMYAFQTSNGNFKRPISQWRSSDPCRGLPL